MKLIHNNTKTFLFQLTWDEIFSTTSQSISCDRFRGETIHYGLGRDFMVHISLEHLLFDNVCLLSSSLILCHGTFSRFKAAGAGHFCVPQVEVYSQITVAFLMRFPMKGKTRATKTPKLYNLMPPSLTISASVNKRQIWKVTWFFLQYQRRMICSSGRM